MAGWISLAVSIAALVASLVALYRSYLAPARIRVIPGALRLRIYDYSSDGEDWWMPVFNVTISFTNVGARAGTVDGLRLRVCRDGVMPSDNFETFQPVVTLDRSLGLKYDSRTDREAWLDQAPEWSSFLILPKASVTQHLAFQSGGWGAPVERPLEITLEMYGSDEEDWRALETWTMKLDTGLWAHLANGMPTPAYARSRVDAGPRSFPEDLLPQP